MCSLPRIIQKSGLRKIQGIKIMCNFFFILGCFTISFIVYFVSCCIWDCLGVGPEMANILSVCTTITILIILIILGITDSGDDPDPNPDHYNTVGGTIIGD